jgi:LPXTG-motif cell wall-anchored protein
VNAAQVSGTLPRTGHNDDDLAMAGYRILLLGVGLVALAFVLRHRTQAFRTR